MKRRERIAVVVATLFVGFGARGAAARLSTGEETQHPRHHGR